MSFWQRLRRVFFRKSSNNYRGGWDDQDNDSLYKGDHIQSIHVHKAANGHVVEHFGKMNSNGERKQTLWVVPEGANITDSITRAVVAGSFDK